MTGRLLRVPYMREPMQPRGLMRLQGHKREVVGRAKFTPIDAPSPSRNLVPVFTQCGTPPRPSKVGKLHFPRYPKHHAIRLTSITKTVLLLIM